MNKNKLCIIGEGLTKESTQFLETGIILARMKENSDISRVYWQQVAFEEGYSITYTMAWRGTSKIVAQGPSVIPRGEAEGYNR